MVDVELQLPSDLLFTIDQNVPERPDEHVSGCWIYRDRYQDD